ncbi:MAG: hypothetical protein WDZ76_06890 [Pseudohongiellaceae bacterium]
MKRILLTGFTPFDGRAVNASWLAATALADHIGDRNVRALELPVLWGKPAEILTPVVCDWKPDLIIGFGEGKPEAFRLETVARNQRSRRLDNNNAMAPAALIEPGGPALIKTSVACSAIVETLALEGTAVLVSNDAGAYLCEELLYVLERLRVRFWLSATVLFVHLPPHGTTVMFRGKKRRCDGELMGEFAVALFDSMNAVLENRFVAEASVLMNGR